MSSRVATFILNLFGWRLDQHHPEEPKVVIIGAPHTSNWDFPLTMLAKWGLNYPFNWVGKHSMFFWPFAGLFRKLGGVPINRAQSEGFTDQIIEVYNKRERFALAIAPEGTRSYRPRWKTGFYRIAIGAKVPIALGYIDYKTKTLGIGMTLNPSGNIDKDFELIAAFYADKTGKFPDKQSPVTPK